MNFNTKYAQLTNASVYFAQYDNGRVGFFIRSDDNYDRITPTVILNVDIFNSDYVLIKDYAENEGMLDELIRHGIVEPKIVARIPVEFVQIPIVKLTAEYIAIRDEQISA